MAQSYFPLFFTYHDRVFGKGFMADVISLGGVLAAIEADEHWVYGVQPGSFAATGETPSDALNAYRQSFRNVLLDLADESESSMAFKEAVKEMFFDVNIVREQEWRSAVDKVREGKVTLENIRRVDADTESYIQVEFKDLAHVSPADNYPSELEPPALAA